MTIKELRRKLMLLWTIFLIEIPALALLAYLMNNIDGFRFIPFELDDPMVRIYILIAFAVTSIPMGYFMAMKKIRSLKNENEPLAKAMKYKGIYSIRIAVVNGNAFFCIFTYYGLDMPVILAGIPVYLLILLFDKPAPEATLEQLLNEKKE